MKGPQMHRKQAYETMVLFLGDYYKKTKLDDLGGLLGGMSPFLWTNRKPIDPDMMKDWYNIIKTEELSETECYTAIIKFIKIKEKEFDYNLDQIIKDMEQKTDMIKELWRHHFTYEI